MLKYNKEDLNVKGSLDAGLKKIKGIGLFRSKYLCSMVGINQRGLREDIDDECLEYICMMLNKDYKLGEELKKSVLDDIRKKKEVGCYAGIMHKIGMPVRGQSTKNNRKTARKLNIHFIDRKILYSRLSGRDKRKHLRMDKRIKKQEKKLYVKKK